MALVGYDQKIDGDRFSIELDATTLFSTLSVAYDINGNNTLQKFQFIDYIMPKVLFNGNWYEIGRYYDLQNPVMKPMHCIGPINHKPGDFSDFNCVHPVGNTMGIPFFKHAGADKDFPSSCDCNTEVGLNDYCDIFDLFIGVLVWGSNAVAESAYDTAFRPYLPVMEYFYLPPPVTVQQGNELIYPAVFAGLYNGDKEESRALFKNTTWRKNVFSFSDTPHYGTASVIAFRFSSAYDKTISGDNTQLYNGACYDSMMTPYWNNFLTNPYGKLTENYYQCTKSVRDALLTSIGISSSTAGSIVGLVFTLMISLIMSIMIFVKEEQTIHVDVQYTPIETLQPDDVEFNFLVNEEENKIAMLDLHIQKLREEIREITEVLG